MKYVFILVGLLFVAVAYIGILLPGIPTTFPALIALWFFGKSSPGLEQWLKHNKLFGRFVRDWQDKRIYPKAGKITMYIMLGISTVIFFIRFSIAAGLAFLVLTLALVLWSLPYPENREEYEELQSRGRKKYSLRDRITRNRVHQRS